MKLPDAPWRDWEGMAHLIAALDGRKGLTRYVGGCVRDTLLGLEVSDVDLATQLRPDEVVARLKAAGIKAVPTGIAHGTVTAVLNGRPIEVTTLRRDVATDGRHAMIAYTDRWEEDAARRDFTINALSADPEDGTVSDYFGGLADLDARRVRFIGDPLTRIAEDHLRILRFFRFQARFGLGPPDSRSLEACAARANDLMALSRERIADELTKLLALPDPRAAVRIMMERGVLAPVVPEITLEGADRLDRLVARERETGIPPDPIRRLAALIGRDPDAAAAIPTRLRMSNALRSRLQCLAEHHVRRRPEALAYAVGTDAAIDLMLLDDAVEPAEVRTAVAVLAGWRKPRLPVRGGELIARGLREGPIVATTLQAIERDWVDAGFPNAAAIEPIVAARLAQALRDTRKSSAASDSNGSE